MNSEEFQQHARMYVLGSLDAEEIAAFERARKHFGTWGESFIEECRKLHAAFALSLPPHPPHKDGRERLLSKVRDSVRTEPGSPQKV